MKPAPDKAEGEKPIRFAERLCFSTVDQSRIYKDSQMNKENWANKESVINTASSEKFRCACHADGGDNYKNDELGKALPEAIYYGIDKKTAVTKWLGERMDLGMAVDGLVRLSGRS